MGHGTSYRNWAWDWNFGNRGKEDLFLNLTDLKAVGIGTDPCKPQMKCTLQFLEHPPETSVIALQPFRRINLSQRLKRQPKAEMRYVHASGFLDTLVSLWGDRQRVVFGCYNVQCTCWFGLCRAIDKGVHEVQFLDPYDVSGLNLNIVGVAQAATKILARQLIRLRQQIAKLQGSRAQMRGVATHTQVRNLGPWHRCLG